MPKNCGHGIIFRRTLETQNEPPCLDSMPESFLHRVMFTTGCGKKSVVADPGVQSDCWYCLASTVSGGDGTAAPTTDKIHALGVRRGGVEEERNVGQSHTISPPWSLLLYVRCHFPPTGASWTRKTSGRRTRSGSNGSETVWFSDKNGVILPS